MLEKTTSTARGEMAVDLRKEAPNGSCLFRILKRLGTGMVGMLVERQ